MKNLLFYSIIIFSLSLSGCLNETQRHLSTNDEHEAISNTNSKNDLGRIFKESGYLELKNNTGEESWRRVDDLYRKTIKEKAGDPSLFNFQKSTIKGLVFTHGFLDHVEDDNLELIEFYTQEIHNQSRISLPNCSFAFLTKLKGYWEDEKITSYAKVAFDRGISYQEKYIYAIGKLNSDMQNEQNEAKVKLIRKTITRVTGTLEKHKKATEDLKQFFE